MHVSYLYRSSIESVICYLICKGKNAGTTLAGWRSRYKDSHHEKYSILPTPMSCFTRIYSARRGVVLATLQVNAGFGICAKI